MSAERRSAARTRRRRISYTLAASAAGAAAGADDAAQAAIVYSGLQDIALAQGNYQILRLDTDNRDDIQLKNYVFGGVNYQGAFLIRAPGRFVGFQSNTNPSGTTLGYASALGVGAMIAEAELHPDVFVASLAHGANNPSAQFNNAADKYLGFRFRIGSAPTATDHFAWLRVTINNAAGTFLIRDWAYQSDPGVGIRAGAGGLGDFDGNTAVDGNDFLVWQRGLGGGFAPEQLDSWKQAFGNPGALAAAAATATPEAATLGMLAAGAPGLSLLRRLRRRVP